MELKDLIAADRREVGLGCHNCEHLGLEYDLDNGGAGVWVCDQMKHSAQTMGFPFERDMPCCRLDFWFSTFSQGLNPNDDGALESAIEEFAKSLAAIEDQGHSGEFYPGPEILDRIPPSAIGELNGAA